jgi:uncharacterized protein YjgD (DUF1641 family)
MQLKERIYLAKAITRIDSAIPSAEEQRELAKDEILEAAVKNKESILLLMDIVNDLKQAGVLEMAHAFISNSHQIGVIGMNQLNKSGAQNMIKNSVGAAQFLAKLEPGKLELLLGALASGADNALGKSGKTEKVGIFGMLKAMGSPDIRAAFGFLLNFLRGVGKHMQRSPS